MTPRNRIFILIGILFVISLFWYFFTAQHVTDLQLIGTVDANEVVVSSRIPGRLQTLTVDEGDDVKAGQLIATIDSQDLAAARQAAEATAASQRYKLMGATDTERQTLGGTSSQVTNAEAQLRSAQAALVQAQAAAKTVSATRGDMQNARALLDQAQVQLGYAQVVSPISGKVNVRAARQGEVVAATTPIVTITDLTQTWIYAPLPETEADAVQLGDSLRVVMPSGATIQGKVIAKSAEADFATQRDVSRRKRDIKTIRLKLLIDNPEMRYVPGMLAEVYIPKNKLVNP